MTSITRELAQQAHAALTSARWWLVDAKCVGRATDEVDEALAALAAELAEQTDAGPWRVSKWAGKAVVQSDDFTHDVALIISGNFEGDAQRMAYANTLAAQLNAAKQTDSVDPTPGLRLEASAGTGNAPGVASVPLPCPFCGKADTPVIGRASDLLWDEESEGPYPHSDSFSVLCNAARPDGPGGCGASGGYFPTEAEAIAAWNRRTAGGASAGATQPNETNPVSAPLSVEAQPDLAALLKEARDALNCARRFIENGVEFGAICMPDAPDPALETPGIIAAAIARIDAALPRSNQEPA